jgi:hypothetical protein
LPTNIPAVNGGGAIVSNGNRALEAGIPFVINAIGTARCLCLSRRGDPQTQRGYAYGLFKQNLHLCVS